MADILYTYKNQVYANITNRCNCSCTFCIRSHQDSVGDAETLWHKEDPSAEEIKAAMDAFDFTGYDELVYCGYGEPTCRLDVLLETAKYARENYGVSIRILSLIHIFHWHPPYSPIALPELLPRSFHMPVPTAKVPSCLLLR